MSVSVGLQLRETGPDGQPAVFKRKEAGRSQGKVSEVDVGRKAGSRS